MNLAMPVGSSPAGSSNRLVRSARGRRLLPFSLIGIGLFILASALAQPAKAELGQHLLSRTFDARLAAPVDQRDDPARWRAWPWADISPIAELHFPTQQQSRVVLDSASGEALAWGVGHVPGTTSLGEAGPAAVAGHRDGQFALLSDVQVGDPISLTTVDGRTHHYIVDDLEVVDSRRARLPAANNGPAELILTTCWPIDAVVSGPERLVVRALPSA